MARTSILYCNTGSTQAEESLVNLFERLADGDKFRPEIKF